ncbi:AMIN-like domain-containing (lipo)protein [Nesterenkonia sandarakina]|nr:hypothetical protein [Nesterenkonia sandarakina]
MRHRAVFLTASIAAGTLVLASCASPDEESEPAATSASPSPTVEESSPQETEAPEPSPEETETDEEDGSSESEEEGSTAPEDEPTTSEDPAEDRNGDGDPSEASEDDAPDLSQFGAGPQDDEFASDSEERSTLIAIRHGQHQGYERLVLEFSDAPPTSVYARFVDEAISGMPDVGDTSDQMEGLEVLELRVNGIVEEDPQHAPELHSGEHWYPPQSDLVAEVSLGMLFEGMGTYFVGLNAETEYQLTLANDPHRIIVDFATQ